MLPPEQLVQPADQDVVLDPAGPSRTTSRRERAPTVAATAARSRAGSDSCASRAAMTAWTLAGAGRRRAAGSAAGAVDGARRERPARVHEARADGLDHEQRVAFRLAVELAGLLRAMSGRPATLGGEPRGLRRIERPELDVGQLPRSRSSATRAASGCAPVDLLGPDRARDEQPAPRGRSEAGSAATPACRGRTTGGRRGRAGAAVGGQERAGEGLEERLALPVLDAGRRTGQVRPLGQELRQQPSRSRSGTQRRAAAGAGARAGLRSQSVTGAYEQPTLGGVGARPGRPDRPAVRPTCDELLGQPRLADAGLAADEEEVGLAGGHPPPGRHHRGPLPPPTDQRDGIRRPVRRTPRLARSRSTGAAVAAASRPRARAICS